MKNISKTSFYIGAFFLISAVFSVSFLPILLKKSDHFHLFTSNEFKNLAVVFGVFAGVFWMNAYDFFKHQLFLSLIIAAFLILAILYNNFAIFP